MILMFGISLTCVSPTFGVFQGQRCNKSLRLRDKWQDSHRVTRSEIQSSGDRKEDFSWTEPQATSTKQPPENGSEFELKRNARKYMKIPDSIRKNRYNDSEFKIYQDSDSALSLNGALKLRMCSTDVNIWKILISDSIRL